MIFLFLLHQKHSDCFIELQTFYRRQHSFFAFCFLDGTEQIPVREFTIYMNLSCSQREQRCKCFFFFLFGSVRNKTKTRFIALSKQTTTIHVNGPANLWLCNSSVCVSMCCCSSPFLFLSLIINKNNLYVCPSQIKCLVT